MGAKLTSGTRHTEPRDNHTQPSGIGVAVVTVSDSRTAGERKDEATPRLVDAFTAAHWNVFDTALVPDEEGAIAAVLRQLADRPEVQVVVTTGGTGFGPRDVTPEATRSVLDREAPGLMEAARSDGATRTPMAWLSRGVAGLCGNTVIANLPGSPKGAIESLEVLLPLLTHAVHTVGGHGHD